MALLRPDSLWVAIADQQAQKDLRRTEASGAPGASHRGSSSQLSESSPPITVRPVALV